jgi:hypothetical protein
MGVFGTSNTGAEQDIGLILRESSCGKIVPFVRIVSGGIHYIGAYQFTNATTYAGTTYKQDAIGGNVGSMFDLTEFILQISDDTTNRILSYSDKNGVKFYTFTSHSKTSFITPDQIGFAFDPTNTTAGLSLLIKSWEES